MPDGLSYDPHTRIQILYIYIHTHTHIHTDDTCKPTFCVKAKEKMKEKTPESRIH